MVRQYDIHAHACIVYEVLGLVVDKVINNKCYVLLLAKIGL